MFWCKSVISLLIGIAIYDDSQVNANCNPAFNFQCDDNGDCISLLRACDGVSDCSDGSDEANCTDCAPNTMACGIGCNYGIFRCNGRQNCGGNTDETNCTECSYYDAFTCSETGTCLYHEKKCDGKEDCPNGDDENCPEGCDNEYYFTCKNGDCVKQFFVCDGDNDCSDGSDEQQCDRFALDNDNEKLCYKDPAELPDMYRVCISTEPGCTLFFTEQITITVDKEAQIIITGYDQMDAQVNKVKLLAQASDLTVSTSLQRVKYLDVEIKWSDSIPGNYTVTSFETCSQHHYCEFAMCEI